MKIRLLLLLSLPPIVGSRAAACDICAAEQPTWLRGLKHGGPGPQGGLDYFMVIATIALALFALVWAIKCLARPGESQPDHIKRAVLNFDHDGG